MLEAISFGVWISAVAALLGRRVRLHRDRRRRPRGGPAGRPERQRRGHRHDDVRLAVPRASTRAISRCVRRLFHASAYVLAFVAVVLSLSRGNWLALVAAHAVFFLLVSRPLFLAMVAATVLLATVAFPLLPDGGARAHRVARHDGGLPGCTASGSGPRGLDRHPRRVRQDRLGHVPRRRPSGATADSFVLLHARPSSAARYGMSRSQRDAHNIVIKLAAENGVIGLAAFAWLAWAVLRCGWRLWRANSTRARARRGAARRRPPTRSSRVSRPTRFLYTKQISAYFWVLYALSCARVRRAPVSVARGCGVSARRRRPRQVAQVLPEDPGRRVPAVVQPGSALAPPRRARGAGPDRPAARARRARCPPPRRPPGRVPRPASRSNPSQVIRLATIARPIASPAWSLFFMPVPKRNGLTTTVARARWGRTSGTKPVTTTRRPSCIAMICSGGSGPTITARASGRPRQTSGMMSRIRCSAASALGGIGEIAEEHAARRRPPSRRPRSRREKYSDVATVDHIDQRRVGEPRAQGRQVRARVQRRTRDVGAAPGARSGAAESSASAQLDALPGAAASRRPRAGAPSRAPAHPPGPRGSTSTVLARHVLQRVALPAVEDGRSVRARRVRRARACAAREHRADRGSAGRRAAAPRTACAALASARHVGASVERAHRREHSAQARVLAEALPLLRRARTTTQMQCTVVRVAMPLQQLERARRAGFGGDREDTADHRHDGRVGLRRSRLPDATLPRPRVPRAGGELRRGYEAGARP